MRYSNIFYFFKLAPIGGTEQFLYEIAKKYKDYDITIVYSIGDLNQIKRLKKYVRVIKHQKGDVIECNKAFFNFNLDIINDVKANEYYFVSHANYEELHRVHGGYIPPIDNPKLTHYIGVSKFASDKLAEYGKKIKKPIKVITCYNPLTLEPKEKVLHIVSAGRLDDVVKGGARTMKLIEALDKYCEQTGRHYIWTIFTNPTNNVVLKSKNVAIMPPRLDVRPYIADADYLVQLSNDMETYGYSINEAWSYGVPVVRTPLSIANELPLTEDMSLVCDWDMSNVDEIAKQMFERKAKKFTYTPPADNWLDLIDPTKSNYKDELDTIYEVEALDTYEKYNVKDNDLGYIPNAGDTFTVNKDRLDVLLGENAKNRIYVKVIKAIKPKKKGGKTNE
jgi:hypothetical protein